jgi:hypothetical protein
MLTVCIVAAFAVGAIAATSASATLPEWGKCVKLPATIKGKERKAGTGKFSNSNCTIATTGGEFEFVHGTSELPNTAFTNTMTSHEALLELSDGINVKCTSQVATGNLSGTKEVSNVEVTFKGCITNFANLACENFFKFENVEEKIKTEYTEGEILTRRLKGHLGYISGKGTATPVVGLELEPEQKHNLFAFFGCGQKSHAAGGAGTESAVPIIFSQVGEKPTGTNGGDSIISPISPVNTMGKETTQTYKEKKKENPETHEIEAEKGVQEPQAFEGGKPDFLETQLLDVFGEITWQPSAQEETAATKLNSEEELEIKA